VRGYFTFEAAHLKGLVGLILGEISRVVLDRHGQVERVVGLTASGDKFMMTAEIARRGHR
jgi:hypothetical protein